VLYCFFIPPKNEQLRQENPIDISKVPAEIREGVFNFRSFQTKEEWAKITESWLMVYQKTALVSRKLNQTQRNKVAKDMIKEWGSKFSDEGLPSYDPATKLLLALFCLSDHQLDLAISTFLPQKLN